MNIHRGSDQQRKKDRQHHRGYEPLAKIEFVCIRHLIAFLWLRRERNTLSHR